MKWKLAAILCALAGAAVSAAFAQLVFVVLFVALTITAVFSKINGRENFLALVTIVGFMAGALTSVFGVFWWAQSTKDAVAYAIMALFYFVSTFLYLQSEENRITA